MTATLAPPPDVEAPAPDRRSPRRAVRRWAWRMLRREWRQQLLVLCLLTVAVAVTTVGLGLVSNVQSTDQGIAGTAQLRVEVDAPGTQSAAIVAAASARLGTVESVAHASIPVPGSVSTVDLRDQRPHGHFTAPMLRLVSGAYPVGAAQIAVTRSVASTFALHIGDTWTVDGQARRVVGIVENPKDLQDEFALVAPGQITDPTSLSLFADAGGDAVQRLQLPAGNVGSVFSTGGASSARERQTQALAVLLLATIGLTFIGLLAVAGFTVMAQRRLRAIGMLGAIGGSNRQIRGVMFANGVAVGTVGAALGTALGLLAWFALRPAFEHLVGHRIDATVLPWWAVIAAGALAVLTSFLASWWPARTVARMPIVAALSGRPPAPQPAHRFAVAGTVVAAAGFVLLVLARGTHTMLIVTGIVATSAGMLLLAPLGIRALAMLAGRAPVAVRLALRDLARYQARSGAALAAVTLAIGIAATIAITAAAQQAHDRTFSAGTLPTNQLIVWLDGGANSGPPIKVHAMPSPLAQDVTAGRDLAAGIAQALHAAAPAELDVMANPEAVVPAGAPPAAGWATVVRPMTFNGHPGFTLVTIPYLATPALLNLYHVPASAVHSGAGILTGLGGIGDTKLFDGVKDELHTVPIQVLHQLPQYSSAPTTLITAQEATSLGLTVHPVGWLVQTSSALTAAQIDDARHRAAAVGLAVETRAGPDHSLQQLREYSTLVGVLVALGVLAMTIGLIRSESSGDLRTLTAAGASGGTRRMLTAATAGALALLGAVLGVAGAYLAQVAWHWHHVSYLNRPPYAELGVLLLALPVAALLGGWLFGRTPTRIARASLD